MFAILIALAVVFVAHTVFSIKSDRYAKFTQGRDMYTVRELVVSLLVAIGPALAGVSVITAFAFV